MIAYLIVMLALMVAIAGTADLVVGNIQFGRRRQDMVSALHYAQGGSAIACMDLNRAYTNQGSLLQNLTADDLAPYHKNETLSTSDTNVYERTITAPFTDQRVLAQLWMTNVSRPEYARVLTTATVGNSTQTSQVGVEMRFGWGAAIISTAEGNTSTGASKGVAQDGNAVVLGGGVCAEPEDWNGLGQVGSSTPSCTPPPRATSESMAASWPTEM